MKTSSKCGNCSGAPWTCRVCGGKRCAHLCGRKGTDLTALCGPCKRETGKLTPPTVRKPGMDTYRAVELAEGFGEPGDEEEVLAAWQHLVDTKLVWQLQGFFGRTAMRLIEDGLIHA